MLVDREPELAVLEAVLDEGGSLLVEGPPGIGKSSLLKAARERAGERRMLSARGGELERELPFGIVRQLLEAVLMSSPDRSALLTGAAALAEPVLVEGTHDEGQFAAWHGLYWLAVNLAGRQPLLVLVDDAQWADLPSLGWLVYLARRLEGVPVALVVATRHSGDLLDELATASRVLRPRDLGQAAVGALVHGDPEFVAACHKATGGNPFLIRELLGELERLAIAPTRDNAHRVTTLSSQEVGRSVRARLGRLGQECVALATAVAVLGDPAEPAVAARLAGLDDPSDAADRLAEASILEPRRPLAFVHALVRAGVEAELGAGERARLHERAAGVLAEAGAPSERIALHVLATHPRGDADAAATLCRAAAGASARGAPDVAVTFLRRALEEGADVAQELGAAALRAGDLDTAIARLGDPGALATALFLAFRPAEAVAVLDRAIDALSDGDRELGLRLQATRWSAARADLGAWRALRARGDRFEAGDGGTTGERLALATRALHAVRERTAAEARELAGRALDGGGLLDDPGPESAGFWIAPLVLLWADALDDAIRVATEAMEWATRHGSLPAHVMAARLRAFAHWRRGALGDAEADATGALEHPPLPGFPPYDYGALANVLLARGDPDAAEAVLRDAPFEPGRSVFYFLQARARARIAGQRGSEALEDLRACGRLEREWDIRTPAFCTWRAEAAPLLPADEGLRLAREELQRCRAFGAAGPLGAALRAAGAVAGDEALLREAVDVADGSRLDHALARLELGRALRRAGRRVEARTHLDDALEAARACGAGAVAASAHDELVAAGARPRRDPTESRSHLTAAELRVARLAAEGLTNREVAQALFLTENTIQTHLRSVFRKLEIGSRSQLARAL